METPSPTGDRIPLGDLTNTSHEDTDRVVSMDTPRPTDDRVPLRVITNTTHGGNHTRPRLVALEWDRSEKKRQRERERYATMSDEKRNEINEKRRQRYKMNRQGQMDLGNSMAAHSTDGNTTNTTDENSDWLHRHPSYGNSLQQLSGYLLC